MNLFKNDSLKKLKQKRKAISEKLKWMDLLEVRADCMVLKHDKKVQLVKGIKVIPHNLFLENRDDQLFRVAQYRIALNQLNFPVYLIPVLNPIDVDKPVKRLNDLLQQDLSADRQDLIHESLHKLDLFCFQHQELEFYMMIKGEDNKQFQKQYYQLIQYLTEANFQVERLHQKDYLNYLANVLENDQINDYYFAQNEFEDLMDYYDLNKQWSDEVFLFESNEIFEVLNEAAENVATLPHFNFEQIDFKELGLQENQVYLLCSYKEIAPNHKHILFRFKLVDGVMKIVEKEKGGKE